jgi:hypothetical protein
MTDVAITPAVGHLLSIVANKHSTIREKLAAAETLLSYEAPEPVTERAKQFLVQVMANPQKYRTEYRLLAGKLLRKAEAKKVVQRSVAGVTETAGERETRRRLTVARRRLKLIDVGLWPAPPGWDDTLVSRGKDPVEP